MGFTYETATARVFYRYVLNAQGDVIALLDENYNIVVKYTYDTWGKVLNVTDASGTLITDTTHIGHRNPIRYRGYYYDIETRLYYLQSRYYDPYLGRFISADTYISTGQGILGHNMFAYCGNNPENPYDFNPKGLYREEYAGSYNGKTIKWKDPTTQIPIFEWNEDLRHGSHYHILNNGQHTGDHCKPNTPVPEPWNSKYFGG
ncbi:MAG: RHS repeat-associated core domain-containing protein [Ruminococcaceae bacterium]|nr:RHS repeat-associated core domain-containing protein [Oscillospiraceae bacterium]